MKKAVDRNGVELYSDDAVYLHRLGNIYKYDIDSVRVESIVDTWYTIVHLKDRYDYFLGDSITKCDSPEGLMIALSN